MKKTFIKIFLCATILAISIIANVAPVYGVNINNVSKVTGVNIIKKSDRVVFKWKKVKNAKGYQIKVTKDKDFKKELLKINITKNNNKYAYKKLKSFTKGKKYYVKIRAYKKIDGVKKFGKWSKIKNLEIKKKDNNTGYWCDQGGTHHSFSDNTIGWYNTAEEAEEKAYEYMIKSGVSANYLIEQCDFCNKWSAVITLH